MRTRVLITGAAGGLGKAFVTECARRGWDVVMTDLEEEKLRELARGTERLYGVKVWWKSANLASDSSRRRLWRWIERKGLRFHGLINVAGLDYEGPVFQRDAEQLAGIIDLNVRATVAMSRGVLEYRDERQRFWLINVSSLAAFYPMPGKATYAASKRFVLDFSLAMAEELRDWDATVTTLCPAGMPTNAKVIKAIHAQGWLGRITTSNVGSVASATIDHALKGRRIYIPGLLNRMLRVAGLLAPAGLVASVIGRRWKQAQRKSGAAAVTAPMAPEAA